MVQKIIYASESTIPSAQANSVQVMQMCNAFAQAGHEVTLFARASQQPEPLAIIQSHYGVNDQFAIQTLPFRTGLIGRFRYGWQVARYAKRQRADLLYARCAYSALLGCLLRIPTILELHSLPAQSARVSKTILPRLFQSSSLNRVVCITKSLKTDLLLRFKLNEEQVIVCPDGANRMNPQALERPVASLTERIGSSAPCIGYLGSLYPGKGMEVIVPLAKKLPQQQFVVIGGDREGLAHWRQQAEGQGNIHFIGRVAPADTAAYCNQFSIALVPNQRQVSGVNGADIGEWTSPLKVFEYMSLGKPILASRLAVLEEVLADEQNCLLCDPADIDDWAAKTTRLLNDQALAARLGKQAQIDLEEKYSWYQRAVRTLATGMSHERQQ
ncbi:glycosyltransferase family 4 protein [Planctomycetaceae bacterium SH139]